MSKRRVWPWIALGFVFGLPCLGGGIALTWMRIGFSAEAGSLKDELAKAQEAGLATETIQLRAMSYVPPEDNAANLYRQSFPIQENASSTLKYDNALWRFLRYEEQPGDEALLRKALHSVSPGLEILKKASQMPGLCWNRQWELGWDLTFPEISKLRAWTRLLCAEALIEAKDGRMETAFEALAIAEKIGAHCSQEPTVMAVMAQYTIDREVCTGLAAILDRNRDPDTLQLAGQTLRSFPPVADVEGAYSGNMVIGLTSIQRLAEIASELDNTDSVIYGGFGERWLIQDAKFRAAMAATFARYERRAYLAVKGVPDWATAKSRSNKVWSDLDADPAMPAKFVRPVISAGDWLDRHAQCIAVRRILAIGLGALSAKNSTGAFPTVSPISGPSAVDPFSGKPLRYRLSARELRIYSVDHDAKDDGGLTTREDRKGRSRTHDIAIVFHLK